MALGRPKLLAITVGFIALLLLYAFYAFAIGALPVTVEPMLIAIGGYVVLVLAGFAAGAMAKNAGVINGAIVGVFAPIANVAYMLATERSWSHIRDALVAHGLFWAFAGILFCGLGGLIWDSQRRLVRR